MGLSPTEVATIYLGGRLRRRLPAVIRPAQDPAVRQLLAYSGSLTLALGPRACLGPLRAPLVAALLDLYREDPALIRRRLTDFVNRNRETVVATIESLSHRSESARVLTPETLLVLERLQNARHLLVARWPASLPRRDLDLIAALAGCPLPD